MEIVGIINDEVEFFGFLEDEIGEMFLIVIVFDLVIVKVEVFLEEMRNFIFFVSSVFDCIFILVNL